MFTKIRVVSFMLASLLSASGTVWPQDDVKIKVIPVADNIHMLMGKGGNIGVFTGADGTFVVDDQFAPLSEKILAAIKSIGGDTPDFC